jgi:hypothetical protein
VKLLQARTIQLRDIFFADSREHRLHSGDQKTALWTGGDRFSAASSVSMGILKMGVLRLFS